MVVVEGAQAEQVAAVRLEGDARVSTRHEEISRFNRSNSWSGMRGIFQAPGKTLSGLGKCMLYFMHACIQYVHLLSSVIDMIENRISMPGILLKVE